MKIKKTIKVKCTDGFRQYTNDGKATLLAEVEEDKEYVAYLHEETQEYFAHDQEGREFLAGEIRWNKESKRDELVLIEGLELVEDKENKRIIIDIDKENTNIYIPDVTQLDICLGIIGLFDMLAPEGKKYLLSKLSKNANLEAFEIKSCSEKRE